MKRIIKNGIYVFLLAMILILLFSVGNKIREANSLPIALPAIEMRYAKRMVKRDECYIIQVTNPEKMEGQYFYEEDGEKKPIALLGKDPRQELSYIFMGSEQNKFLVKGYVIKDFSEYVDQIVFYVEDWEIIKPVKRDYGYKEYRPEQRFYYPKDCLDEYDLINGDYHPTVYYDIFMENSEGNYYLKKDGYYKIEPRWNGKSLEWYLIEDEKKIPIDLKGNLPEYSFDTILKNIHSYEYEEYNNYFIVKGKLSKNEKNVLEIYKWWLEIPFSYNDTNFDGKSSCYGFNHSDLEQGVYKRYR